MKSLNAALDAFLTRVTQSVGIYSAITGIFLYHVVFDKDFECTCKDQTIVCIFYMILPVFIILVLVLWLDGSFHVLIKYSCLKCTRKFCRFLLVWIFRAVFIGLLWLISVMIDGDWYICCCREENLYCRNQTSEDQMTIKDLKMTSRVIGFGILLGIILLVAAGSCFPWKECWTCLKRCCTSLKRCCTSLKGCQTCLKGCCTHLKECWTRLKGCCTCKSNDSTANSESESLSEDVLFKKIVLEEGKNLVTNKMIEAVKGDIDERIKNYVSDGEWLKCYDIVDEIITESSTREKKTQTCDEPVTGNHGGESDVEEEETGQSPSDRLLPESSSKGKKPEKHKNYESIGKRGKGSGDETDKNPLIHGSSSESPSNDDDGGEITVHAQIHRSSSESP